MKRVHGKVAVVTGGGSGIGRATCEALAGQGATVAVCDVRPEAAAETVEKITAGGGRATVHGVDVSSEEQMRALVADVLDQHHVVDIVVNNAGISTAPAPTAETDLAIFHKVLDVNLWGTIHGSRLFLPHLLERSEANLVNVCSFAGLMGMTGMSPYNISKFGVRGLTESLQIELAPTALTVTLVCPGGTKTSIMTNSPVIPDSQRDALQRSLSDSKSSATPEDVAKGIMTGILRNKTRVMVGIDTKILDKLTRHLPGAYPKLMHKQLDRMYKQTLG
jgi:NAD(P)-dependent dehydrogenase (short-subunit alcohol dehydrogenase family)